MVPAFRESGDWLYAVEGLTKPRNRSHKPGVKMALVPAVDDTLITMIKTDFVVIFNLFHWLTSFSSAVWQNSIKMHLLHWLPPSSSRVFLLLLLL